MHHIFRTLIVLTVIQVAITSAAGPRVDAVKPGIGQQGTTFDVRIEGSGFTEGCELLFYRPELTTKNLKIESESVLIATLQASSQCSLGIHVFRVRSNQGVSDLRVINVASLPLMNEVEPNNNAVTAQSIAAGSTVVGVLAGDDVDVFKLTLKKGQRLAAEVEAVRLAANLTDLKLVVRDPNGEVVATADDTPLGKQDPYVTLVALHDGDYVIELTSSGGEGGENARYALHLGHFPRPDSVFPPGGPVGKPLTVQVRGDVTAQWQQTVTFLQEGIRNFYPEYQGMTSPTPIPFRVAPFENVLEQEPNNQPTEIASPAVRLPVAFNGILSEPGDRDHYRFRADTGSVIKFTTFAGQLGSVADTVIRILSADGTVLTMADDGIGYDSQLVWRCPKTGEYFLEVTEKRRAGGPRFVYRVEAQPVDPTLVAFLPRRDRRNQSGQTISVPQGNRVLSFVAVRRERWSGDAEIEFPQLLPGVTTQHGRIVADEFLMPVVFEAAADAPIGADLVPVLARSYDQSPSITGEFEQIVDLVAASADRLYQGVTVNRLAVAVVEPSPFRVQLVKPPTALARDGSMELIIQVERDKGFDREIEVMIPFLPTWVDGPEKITIAADNSSGTYLLRAMPEVALGTWPTVAEGKPGSGAAAATGDGTNPAAAAAQAAATGIARPIRGRGRRAASPQEVASQLLSLEIAESPLKGSIGELIATPGMAMKVTIALQKTGPVPSKLTATLLGLPTRVEAQPLTISDNDQKLVFDVKFADEAPLGLFSTLICELTGDWDGHKVTYRIGRGGSLKIVRPGELLIDESGRPLSPLEILRRQPANPSESAKATDSQ